jgi:crotonobetaine/carnitine-CoA ligase
MKYLHEREERVLARVLEKRASEGGDKIFLRFRDREFTYATTSTNANRIANGLIDMGISKGDRVCIMLPNCPEFLFTWFGITKMGAIEVPINTAFKGDLLQYIINNCEAETLVVDQQFLDRIEFVADELKMLKKIVVLSKEGSKETKLSSKFRCTSFHELLSSPASEPRRDIKYYDPLAIMYTSGTTGPSKGVVVPHSWGYYFATFVMDTCRLSSSDVWWSCLPCFHMSTQILATYSALLAGGTLVLAERFNPEIFWDEKRKYGVTWFIGVGAIFVKIMNQPEKPDDADNQVRVALGGPVPDEMRGKFERRFGLKIIDLYGQTETNMVTMSPYDGPRYGSCGKPTELFDTKIFDDYDNELPVGEVGEIVVRPKEPFAMMLSYYKMPEETLSAWRNLWFHTGDRGFFDEHGFLHFADRKKEAIRRKGENISSFEVEKVLNSHPAILDTAVIPIKSPMTEDEVKAVVVLREGTTLDYEELIHYCEDRMAFFAIPRYIEIKDGLPRTSTQRVEKYKLIQEGVNENTWDREKAGIKIKR